MDDVQKAFEGGCIVGECDADTEILEVNGTFEFLLNHTFTGDYASEEWLDNDGYEVGEVVFQCAEGHQFSVWAHDNGDWSV